MVWNMAVEQPTIPKEFEEVYPIEGEIEQTEVGFDARFPVKTEWLTEHPAGNQLREAQEELEQSDFNRAKVTAHRDGEVCVKLPETDNEHE